MTKIITLDQLLARLAAAIKAAGGQSKWAARHGFDQSFINNVLARRRLPSKKVCEILGYQQIKSSYEKIE
jgi:hypothetical protein